MKNLVQQQVFNNKVLVVNCGRSIKYAVLDDKLLSGNKAVPFTTLDIEFEADVDIVQLQETDDPNLIQILAKDLS